MTLLCPECFGDTGLKRRIVEIRPHFPKAQCDFHPTYKGVPVEDVAEIIDEVFRQHYCLEDADYFGDGGESLETVIYELTSADEHEVVRAVINQLIAADNYWPPDGEEAFYGDDLIYEQNDSPLSSHNNLWDAFRREILHGQRFFNVEARDSLKAIFDGIHLQRTRNDRWPVYFIEPGRLNASFYRARIAGTEELRKEIAGDVARHLGPPPSRSRRAGRMNPAGIMAFYGAFDLDTCLAELRPTVGSVVMGARFEITEPLCVLDTSLFEAPPKETNIFAHKYIQRAAQWRFMTHFMHEASQPISPADEHLDYIPTQAVAEYLLHHHQFRLHGATRKIEAIIYWSAQNPGGKNIAILGDAAKAGILDEDKPKPKVTDDRQVDHKGHWIRDLGQGTFRLAAKPASLETRRVTGATYPTKPFKEFDLIDDAGDF